MVIETERRPVVAQSPLTIGTAVLTMAAMGKEFKIKTDKRHPRSRNSVEAVQNRPAFTSSRQRSYLAT